MKKIIVSIYLTICACLYTITSIAQTINYAVEVSTNTLLIGVEKVEIFEGLIAPIGVEKWKILGTCSNRPNLKIEIFDGYIKPIGIRVVEIVDGLFIGPDVKKICITNARELDRKTLRKLKLIK